MEKPRLHQLANGDWVRLQDVVRISLYEPTYRKVGEDAYAGQPYYRVVVATHEAQFEIMLSDVNEALIYRDELAYLVNDATHDSGTTATPVTSPEPRFDTAGAVEAADHPGSA